jgi:hypothetical protein
LRTKPYFNDVYYVGTAGNRAPIRCYLDANELTLSAEPDKGDPQEAVALIQMDVLAALFAGHGVKFQELKRNSQESVRLDCIRIGSTIPPELYPYLPPLVVQHLRPS